MLRLMILFATLSAFSGATGVSATKMVLKAANFEIFGRVQGVFFRKYTKMEADKLGVKGWCMNTAEGTVLGHMEGPEDKIESMMEWLRTRGSPSSQIERAEFRDHKEIQEFTYNGFQIKKD